MFALKTMLLIMQFSINYFIQNDSVLEKQMQIPIMENQKAYVDAIDNYVQNERDVIFICIKLYFSNATQFYGTETWVLG